jgi:DNA-binding NarL/FixJ family response regulator
MGESESGTEAVEICKNKHPDIILMDIGLSGLNGIEATGEILRHWPEAKIVILSMYDDEDSVVSAIRSGARALVVKRASEIDLVNALLAVAKGGSYLSPQVSDRLLHRIQNGDLKAKLSPSAVDDLAPRELQVLRLVADGKTSKEIAVTLGLALQTVRSYRKTVMKKLGVNNVAGLTQFALAAGITRYPAPGRPVGCKSLARRLLKESFRHRLADARGSENSIESAPFFRTATVSIYMLGFEPILAEDSCRHALRSMFTARRTPISSLPTFTKSSRDRQGVGCRLAQRTCLVPASPG